MNIIVQKMFKGRETLKNLRYAARFQTRPDIRNNPPLPLPADFHILRAPLAYGNRVFTEHTSTAISSTIRWVKKPISDISTRVTLL